MMVMELNLYFLYNLSIYFMTNLLNDHRYRFIIEMTLVKYNMR